MNGETLHRSSKIVDAIARAKAGTSGEIRVHLSHRWMEKDPLARASSLFERFGMTRSPFRNGVLLYVNLRKRKFAILADEGIQHAVDPTAWDRIAAQLKGDLRSTHSDNAISAAVLHIGELMKEHFPSEEG